VSTGSTYMIKSFLNVEHCDNGEIGYYVDEYDENGKWISGQWKANEPTSFVESINISYRPSSSAVKKARLQLYTTAGTDIEAYVDNVQWFPLTK
ncbi:MAG TPA: hypothetical protein VLA92_03080, partial [Candidatus Saccharimonadales bacterium]|nr:hypothetical protein [Candidatus Saccharimonadales bacterium]